MTVARKNADEERAHAPTVVRSQNEARPVAPRRPAPPSIAALQRLQAGAGNAAVARMLARQAAERTLPGHTADPVPAPVTTAPSVQRDCACGGRCAECGSHEEEHAAPEADRGPGVQRLSTPAPGVPVQRFPDLNPLHAAKKLAAKALGAISGLAASALNTAKRLGTAAWHTVASTGTGIRDTARSAGSSLGRTVTSLGSKAWSVVKSLGGTAWETARDMGAAAWNTARSAGSRAWNVAKELGSTAWHTARATGSTAWNGVKSLGGHAWDAVKGRGISGLSGLSGMAKSVLGRAGSLAHGLAGLVRSALGALSPASLCRDLVGVLGRITASIGNAVGQASRLAAGIRERASGVGRAAVATASRWAGRVKQFATRALSSAYGAVRNGVEKAWNGAKRLGAQAVGSAGHAATAGWNAAKRLGAEAVDRAGALGSAMLSTAQRVGSAIGGTARAAGDELQHLASRLTGSAAATVRALADRILGKASGLLGSVIGTAKSLVEKVLGTVKSLGARALATARAAASRAWQMAVKAAGSASSTAESLGSKAVSTARALGSRAWTTAERLGTKAVTTATGLAGKAWNTAKGLGSKATNTIRGMAGAAWNTAKSTGSRAWEAAKGVGRNALAIAGKAGSGAVGLVKRAASAASRDARSIADAARKFCAFLTKFGPFIKGIGKLVADPGIVANAIRNAVAPMVAAVPGAVNSVVSRFSGGSTSSSPGPGVQRLVVQRQAVQRQEAAPVQPGESVWQGIWRHLSPKLSYLKDHWWEALQQTGRQLVFPWEGMGKDLGELWTQIKKGWSALKSLRFSAAIDAVLAAGSIVTGVLGRWWGWFAIASALVGAVIGSIVPGAGTLAGAGAGFEFAGSVGEGLLAADVTIQTAQILKAFYNVEIQHDTGRTREGDFDQISESGLALGITGAMALLSAAAVRFAKTIIGRVRGLRVEPPKSEPPEVEPPKSETPRTEAPREELPRTEPPKKEPPPGEHATLREKAKAPEKVDPVTDPEFADRYDAEIKVGDHTYRRAKSDGTWCRFSDPECGIEVDEDVNDDVDQVLTDRQNYSEKGGWPASNDVKGPAAGKIIRLPNKRHTISGAKTGEVKKESTLILKGYEKSVAADTRAIAEGKAELLPDGNTYKINGRTYLVKDNGTVFPVDGPGFVQLNGIEYSAFQLILKGDPKSLKQLEMNPKFKNNPEAVKKATAIFEGTYQG